MENRDCHIGNCTSTAKVSRHCSAHGNSCLSMCFPQLFLNFRLVQVFLILLYCCVPSQYVLVVRTSCPNSTCILPCLQPWSAAQWRLVHIQVGRCCQTPSPAAGLITCCGCKFAAWSIDSNLCEGFSGLTYSMRCNVNVNNLLAISI